MPWQDMIGFHILRSHYAGYNPVIRITLTRKQCFPHNFILLKCFCIKCVIYYFGKGNAFFHQLACNFHCLCSGAGILEHACVMHNAQINAFCDLFCDIFLPYQPKHKLWSGTCIWKNIINIRKTGIADMMVYADCLFRRFKITGGVSKPFYIAAVLRNK